MKEAYVTVIIPFSNSFLSVGDLEFLDQELQKCTRNHEIILIEVFNQNLSQMELKGLVGPVSVVYTNVASSVSGARFAALGRASGDFIIEWLGGIRDLDVEMIFKLLEPADDGIELIEVESADQPISRKIFYKMANSLRPASAPVRKCVGRAFSRRALGQLLAGSSFESQINVLFAELPVQRLNRIVNADFALQQTTKERLIEGMILLSKGSRFGTVVPLALAAISVSFGILAALYALFLYIYSGKSPQGWTTLMIVIGLGQASILALIGMTWSRIDSLTKGLSRPYDSTADVVVFPPGI